jgi:hypothetical protein
MVHTTHVKQWENVYLTNHNILQSEGHDELEKGECNCGHNVINGHFCTEPFGGDHNTPPHATQHSGMPTGTVGYGGSWRRIKIMGI